MTAAAILCGASGTLLAVDGRLKLLLLAAFGGGALLFLFFRPRIVFLLWALLVPTQFFWTDDLNLLPSIVRYADDGLLGLLLVRLVLEAVRRGRPLRRTPWDIPLAAFLGIGVLSAVVNGVPLLNAVSGLRAPIQILLILYVVDNDPEAFDRDYLAWVWKLLLVLAALQIGTAVYQYPKRGFGADSLTGTMGPAGANDLGVFLLAPLFYLLSLRFDARDRNPYRLLGIVLMILAPIFSGSRGAWFIALGAAALLWARRLASPRVLVVTGVVGTALAAFVGWMVVALGSASVETAIGPRGIVAALFLVSSGGGNLAYFPVVWRVVLAEAPIPLLGLGPGMVSSSAAVHLDAPVYRNILYDYFGQTRFGLDGSVESQFLATCGETGPLGFAALAAMALLWLVLAWRIHRDGSAPPHARALGAAVFAAAIGSLILTPIRNVWETPHLAFSLWFPALLLLVEARRIGFRGPAGGYMRKLL